MLAHRQGTTLNVSALARGLELSAQSVTRYIDLLCDLLLVRRLPPLLANVGKRLVKAPKVYVRDSGLVHALLGIASLEQLAGHPVVARAGRVTLSKRCSACCRPSHSPTSTARAPAPRSIW